MRDTLLGLNAGSSSLECVLFFDEERRRVLTRER
jgi:hypothetical protein